MNDYREKFNSTKHFEKAIDVAYDSDKEYIRFLKQQLEAKDKVIEAVEIWHNNDLCDMEMCYSLSETFRKYKEEIK